VLTSLSGSRLWTVLAAVAAVCLALGIVLGLVVARGPDVLTGDTSRDTDKAPTLVTLGTIVQAHDSAMTGWDFELPVLNGSDRVVDADLAAFTGVSSPFTTEPARQVAPGAWRVIKFSAPPNCDDPVTGAVPSVTLHLRVAERSSDVTLPLPGQGRALADYDRAVCGSGLQVAPDQLAGIWILERAYGPNMDLAGSLLLRFSRDGSFRADPQGELLSDDSTIRGHYRLHGQVLTISVQNSFGCGAGAGQTWRLTQDAADRLSMVWTTGSCPEGQVGNVWVLRRVLDDTGLPAVG
jgi:hypothetical protein